MGKALWAGEIVQHSWLFDTEENARTAEATFNPPPRHA
jgi:hypothetical protein